MRHARTLNHQSTQQIDHLNWFKPPSGRTSIWVDLQPLLLPHTCWLWEPHLTGMGIVCSVRGDSMLLELWWHRLKWNTYFEEDTSFVDHNLICAHYGTSSQEQPLPLCPTKKWTERKPGLERHTRVNGDMGDKWDHLQGSAQECGQ